MPHPNHDLVAQGQQAFGADWNPTLQATAPGRLELLGNHVDYNGGLVLAGAIDRRVTALAGSTQSGSGMISLFAPNVDPEVAHVPLGGPEVSKDADATSPADYLAGIMQALNEKERPIRKDLQILVSGDVPVGFGMSSSAALCVSLALLLSVEELEAQRLVSIARRAEHIIGAPVGAMDQSASVAGGVILFDGATEQVDVLEPDLGDHVFTVASSGVHHALGQSAYPRRVEESEQARQLICANSSIGVDYLGQIVPQEWNELHVESPSWLPAVLQRRVQHVVSEVARVQEGVQAIRANDWNRFGSLMTVSGRSSAVDYEISHPVVEELVSALVGHSGVLGARMMGGGEGGPALALLRRDAVDDVRASLGNGFFAKHDLDPEDAFEVCAFGTGATLSQSGG